MKEGFLMTSPEPNIHITPEQLLSQYGGLVWNTVSVYLDNPEDIKECVNDTFFEFYAKNNYEFSKGSIATFLKTIAKNQAISRYRHNQAYLGAVTQNFTELEQTLKTDTACTHNQIENLENKIDLEAALLALPDTDFQIIRKKYYEGLTMQEIAKEMKLPYETVKKRHQRSLTKLRQLLITALIAILAMALTACVFRILQYFDIIPGYGAKNTDANTPFYVLEESVDAENETFHAKLKKAYLQDDKFFLYLELTRKIDFTEFPSPEFTNDNWSNQLMNQINLSYGENDSKCTFVAKYLPYVLTDATQTICFEYKLPQELWDEKFTFTINDLSLTFSLESAKTTGSEEYTHQLEKYGGILADAYIQNGHLRADLYFLTVDGYQLSLNQGSATEYITATDSNGNILQGTYDTTLWFNSSYKTWDFGPAKEGTYTIDIPWTYVTTLLEENNIPLPAEGESFAQTEFDIPLGTITLGELTETPPEPGPPTSNETHTVYYLPINASTTADDLQLNLLGFNVQSSTQLSFSSGAHKITGEDGNGVFWGWSISVPKGTPREVLSISPASAYYKWDHKFSLEVSAKVRAE